MAILCVRDSLWASLDARTRAVYREKMGYIMVSCDHDYRPWRTVGTAKGPTQERGSLRAKRAVPVVREVS